MALEQKQYTLGRGRFHLARFRAGTQLSAGFRYIGNTPSASITVSNDALDHFDSDNGVNEKDDSVTLQTNRSMSLVTDNIVPENVALFFFGEVERVTQPAQNALTEVITDIKHDHGYRLGTSTNNPTGFFGIEAGNFEVSDGGAAPVRATGTLTYTGVGAEGDIVTVGVQDYKMTAVLANPFDVLIGADAAASAQNLVAAINAAAGAGVQYGAGTVANVDANATRVGAVVTVRALNAGAGGNDIDIASSVANITASGAKLTGGAGNVYVLGIDYDLEADFGLLTPKAEGSIPDGSDITVKYGVRASIRERVISGNQQVEGILMYQANNPKGKNINYYFPYVRIAPDGDYELKGDTWQQIPLSVEILKPKSGGAAILADGVPAFQ